MSANASRNERIAALFAAGWTQGQIARHLGISNNVVAGVVRRARQNGMPLAARPSMFRPSQPIVTPEATYSSAHAAAAAHGICKRAAARRAQRGMRGWRYEAAHAPTAELNDDHDNDDDLGAARAIWDAVVLSLPIWLLLIGIIVRW